MAVTVFHWIDGVRASVAADDADRTLIRHVVQSGRTVRKRWWNRWYEVLDGDGAVVARFRNVETWMEGEHGYSGD